jgi:hypothetical protein
MPPLPGPVPENVVGGLLLQFLASFSWGGGCPENGFGFVFFSSETPEASKQVFYMDPLG